MKSGNKEKKLVFNKISIAQLDNDNIEQIKGRFPLIKNGFMVHAGDMTIRTIYPILCHTYPDQCQTTD
jgi:hypothetical protein